MDMIGDEDGNYGMGLKGINTMTVDRNDRG